MNALSPSCDSDRIDQFLDGELPQNQVTDFEDHLDHCEQCNAELARKTAEESFWTDASDFLSGNSEAGSQRDTDRSRESARATEATAFPGSDLDPGCDVDELSFLDPTDDPEMMGRFGGYEISGVVGSGGMGLVLKGWDVALDRFVAIKVLHRAYTGQSASRKRFAREAQAAAAVLHDNVISIYGVDQWKGMPFLVMPYIKGESLQQRIDRSAPLELEDILGISLQIARGLAAAHDQGLVHRDIKPANILMPASVSRVIITDFGLARTADDASLTRSGVLAGTPQYMSPEQARSQAVDGRTDLFSLGSVMYAMACGRPPFRADTPYGVLRKITDQPHRPLSQLRPDVPGWFEKTVDRLLDKDPECRFDSAGELADYLEDCLAHLRQPTTTLLPALEEPDPASRGWAGWRLGLLLAALSLAILLGFYCMSPHQPSGREGNAQADEAMRLGQAPPIQGRVPGEMEQDPGGRNHASAEHSIPDTSGQTKRPDASDSSVSKSPAADSAEMPAWIFDDSRLGELESELKTLLQETAIGSVPGEISLSGENDEKDR